MAEDPWGAEELAPAPPQSMTQNIATLLINFHQEVISPADGPRSHFVPSSSQYTKEAIQKYGMLTGVLMGFDRLTRENDELWVYPIVQGPDRTLKYDEP